MRRCFDKTAEPLLGLQTPKTSNMDTLRHRSEGRNRMLLATLRGDPRGDSSSPLKRKAFSRQDWPCILLGFFREALCCLLNFPRATLGLPLNLLLTGI